jgi:Protein of unknown function (DUF1214)
MTSRSTTQKETRSYAAFLGLLDALREAADAWLAPERGITAEVDIAEGFRNALHLVSAGIDFYLEGDPDHPEFVKMVSPTRRFGGDNPDAIYHFARLRGDRRYRIRGRKGDEVYLSFTVHGRNEEGRLGLTAEPVLADVNDRHMQVGPDGRYEVILSPDEQPGNWIRLPPNAASLIVRHYFEGEGRAAADPDTRIELRIERLDEPGPRPPLSDESMAQRIRDVTAFVRGATLDMMGPRVNPPFVSEVPNELGTPMVFRASGEGVWGAVDIAYAMGPFALGPDEALVMEGRFPECAFANVVLWNRHMQCLEFRDRVVSLNRRQTRLAPDGSYRIVVAHRDPGVPNWLDTEGHASGLVFWRFLLPQGTPERPRCRVVRVSELSPAG